MNHPAEDKLGHKLRPVVLAAIIITTAFIPVATAQSTVDNEKSVPLMAQIFTPQGKITVNKEVTTKIVNDLTAPQTTEEWIKKLHEYGLLGGLSIDQAHSLLDGDSPPGHGKGIPTDGLMNVFCSVNVTAGGCMMVPVFPFGCMFHLVEGINYLLSLGIPPFLLLPIWIVMYALYIPSIPIDLVSKFIGMYVPIKSPLFRGFLVGNEVHMKTIGLLGEREVYNNDTTVFRIRGFTGIWLTNPLTHHSWIKGFALTVSQWQ